MCPNSLKLIVIAVISFVAIIAICGIVCVNIKNKRSWGEYSTKLVGITFIVAMAIIAYVYDTSNSNSSLFTLLGTLAGYFLGHRNKKGKKENQRQA